jgi:hypothetical protein
VAGITYVPTRAGFLYLPVVLDAWSRRVVDWATATHLRSEFVLDALQMAVARGSPSASCSRRSSASCSTAAGSGTQAEAKMAVFRCPRGLVQPSPAPLGAGLQVSDLVRSIGQGGT